MIFLECSRYNEYKSNTSNKRIVVETNKKEKGNCYRSAVAKEKSQCFARNQWQRSLLLEQRSKIL